MFEKSSPIRHATELYHQVCKMNDYETELFKEILLVVTEGGGDHNVSHASVQVALICIFLHLDLDMLVAMRTCPTQSWTNVAERVMSLLNIALQHCATEREAMDVQFEKILKATNNMTNLREAASKNPALKNAFATSMLPVMDLIANRFENMKLKDNQVQCFPSASDESVKRFFEIIQRRIDPLITMDSLTDWNICGFQREALRFNFIYVPNNEVQRCGVRCVLTSAFT